MQHWLENITSPDIFFIPSLKKNGILFMITNMTRLYQSIDFFTVIYDKKHKILDGFSFLSNRFFLSSIRIIIIFIHYHYPIMPTSHFPIIRMCSEMYLISFVFRINLYLCCLKKRRLQVFHFFFKPIQNQWMKFEHTICSISMFVVNNMTIIVPNNSSKLMTN